MRTEFVADGIESVKVIKMEKVPGPRPESIEQTERKAK